MADTILKIASLTYAEPTNPFSPYCRGCLSETEELHDMKKLDILEDFYKFTQIEDHSHDSYSIYLCKICLSRLEECQVFRHMCQRAYGLRMEDITKRKAASSVGEGVEESTERPSKPENKVSCLLHDRRLVVMITAPDTEAKIELPCPYRCSEAFLKKPDLLNHMMRRHRAASDFQIELQYCCPVAECAYHADCGSKCFTGRKFLNQHLNKVHGGPALSCGGCQLNFPNAKAYAKHLDKCNFKYECNVCRKEFKTSDRLTVHLMRKHPLFHQQYKMERRAERQETKRARETDSDLVQDNPKRSSSTQTLTSPGIKNDVALPSWLEEPKTDEISTQTALDLLRSQDEDSMYFPEAVLLNDTQTQTFPLEFGLSTSNKETLTSQTQSPDLSIKETQTCCCLYESPRFSARLFDSVSSSPVLSLTSTETQTAGVSPNFDALLGSTCAETQTSFEELLEKEAL